jgi:hypothetical protein
VKRAEVAVIVPVLDRPTRVEPLLQSLAAAQGEHPYSVLFVVSQNDPEETAAVHLGCFRYAFADWMKAGWPPGAGDWARKIHAGVEATTEPWIFTGADDLEFQPGWADEALHVATGARFVGTCDCANPRVKRGQHSTHSLVARSYITELGTIDEPGKLLHEGYDHSFSDDEAVETAKARGEWAFAADSCVCHSHPFFGTAPMDATYSKAHRASVADARLFAQRRRLWARGAIRHGR